MPRKKWLIAIFVIILLVFVIFIINNLRFQVNIRASQITLVQYAGTPREGTGCPTPPWWDARIAASDVVVIDRYRFESIKRDFLWFSDAQCTWCGCCNAPTGGCLFVSGCFWACPKTGCYHAPDCYVSRTPTYVIRVFRNNTLNQTLGFDGGCGSNLTSAMWEVNFPGEIMNISADFFVQSWYCMNMHYSFMNMYRLRIPDNAFTFDIVFPEKTTFYQGENASYRVVINNSFLPVKAEVTTTVCQPVWFGMACDDIRRSVYLDVGINRLDFYIPTNFVADRLEITPTLKLYLNLDYITLSGLNAFPTILLNDLGQTCSAHFGGRTTVTNIDLCKNAGYKFIQIASTQGETRRVSVISRCDVGYVWTGTKCIPAVEWECNTADDCLKYMLCPTGVSPSCINNVCYLGKGCITKPEPKIWDLLASIWEGFLKWVYGLFGW